MNRLHAIVPPLLLAAGLALGLPARADEDIETDRPDFVESSAVVGPGRFQVETGATYDRGSSGGVHVRTLTTPTLLRLGVSHTLELRLEGDGLVHERADDPQAGTTVHTHGFADLSFGVKWHVLDGEGARPSVAWLANVDTATGSHAFRGAGLRPALRAAVEWELPDEFSLGVMPGIYVDRNDSGGRYLGGILAATVGKAWTPRWHSFAEVAGQRLARKRDGGSTVTLDTGIAFLATSSLQFDAEVSHGLSDAAPDLEYGVGMSVRF